MKVSLKWLNKYVDLQDVSVQEIADRLPMLGIEVESLETAGLKPMQNVVVGEILSRQQHPNADKLGVCMVKVSQTQEPIQIVCGASNYKVGDRVPVALEGAELPTEKDGEVFKIKKSKLRDVESNGMMCSARELGMGNDHSGLLILENRPEIGTPINEVFSDTDTVFEIELTANRGDCLSHIGVARELAASFGKELKKPALKYEPKYADKTSSPLLSGGVSLNTENCPLYTAVCIRGVKVAPSPEWLKRDLEAVGLRSINNVVDVTNYVLMEYGQPLHAFDASHIRGGKIEVRQAKEGEKIVTLDEKERILAPENMLICDGEGPVALAGVMGGLDSEVKESTTDLVIESAYFKPGNVRATSRKLSISSDSSYRFARDVDPKSTFDASRRAADLIIETSGGSVEGETLVAGASPRGDIEIEISREYILNQTGFDTPSEEICKSFKNLGFAVKELSIPETWLVTVPSFRADISRPVDLLEEFVRIHGSDKIPETPVVCTESMRDDDPLFKYNRAVADMLAAKGLNECQNYTLCSSARISKTRRNVEFIKLDNPLTADQDCLRASLLDALLDSAKFNLAKGNAVYGMFENGKIFDAQNNGVVNELAASAFVLPCIPDKLKKSQGRNSPDCMTSKALVCDILDTLGVDSSRLNFTDVEDEAFWQNGFAGGCGIISREGFCVRFGAVNLTHLREEGFEHPVFAGEIIFKPEVAARKKGWAKFKPFSPFPSAERDLSLIAKESEKSGALAQEIQKAAKQALKGEKFDLESVKLFDVYKGKGLDDGMKSLAFTLSFRSMEKTLQAEEVNKVFEAICQKVSEKYKLRT